MASVYRKSDARPVPAGAEILIRRRKRGEAVEEYRVARWTDGRGRTHTERLSDEGTKVVIERPCWYIDYLGADGRWHTAKGYRDKEATEARARELEGNAGREAMGLPVADKSKALTPIGVALGLYAADLERQGRDDMYRYNQRHFVERVARECGWETLAEVRPDGMIRWLATARKVPRRRRDGTLVEQGPLAATSKNKYLEGLSAFLNWCVSPGGYLESNPLRSVPKGKATRKERERRALTDAEVARLLALPIPEGRKRVYRTALLSGLRKEEIALLEWGDLDFDRGTITLRETCNKAGRRDTIGLHPQLAAELRPLRPPGASAADRVFPGVPEYETTVSDFRRAGIPRRDAQGRQADFHSLRHTFGTSLQRAGVSPGDAMRLMRHTDLRLTLRVYTDPSLLATAAEVAKLPALGSDGRDGTDNRTDKAG
jgi:integrase